MKIIRTKEEGITLVALIITIIILIILAAITIKVATDFDIVKLAIKSTENYAKAQVDEEKEFDNISSKLENTINNISSIENDNIENSKDEESYEVGDIILYKDNNFKIKDVIGNAVMLVCIPNSNTPKIQIGGWTILQTCEDILNNACRNHFVDEELGIMSEDIYNARKTDYDNGWLEIPNESNEEYWLASGSIQDNRKAYIYLSYMQKGVGISSKLCHVWSGKASLHTLAICPIIMCNSNLIKCSSENQLYIEGE